MSRVIATVCAEIPGHSDWNLGFGSDTSLLHADIVVFSPDISAYETYSELPSVQGKRILDEYDSQTIQKDSARWQRELGALLQEGKTVVVILRVRDEVALYQSKRFVRPTQATIQTAPYDNYRFSPIKLPDIASGASLGMVFSGDPAFATLWSEFGHRMRPEAYFADKVARPILTTKVGAKAVAAVFKVGTGHMVFLPPMGFDDKGLTYHRGGTEYWKAEAVRLGERFVQLLVDTDAALRSRGEATPPPNWVSALRVKSPKLVSIEKRMSGITASVARLKSLSAKLATEAENEARLDALLYEKGKPLENGVTLALQTLGYTAANLADGDLEIDQVIISPEGSRFIGECEGKDDAAVNVDKFRQLQSNIQEDIERNDESEPATGILFGNSYRLLQPANRPAQFSEKCCKRAASTQTVLVQTPDLYRVASYVRATNDREFAATCRTAIQDAKGHVVQFPEAPSTGNHGPV